MTTLPVRPYAPKCQVTIWTDTAGRIDLTERDLFTLSTRRAINSPTGMFDLLLSGRKVGRGSLFETIQPQDYVEIRFARIPSQGGLPVVMRGFCDNVNEATSSGQRRVTVNGRDFGKPLLKFQIYYLNEIDPTATLIQQAGLETRFKIPAGVITPSQFVNLVNDNIVAPNMDALRGNRKWIPSLMADVSVPDRFAVNGLAVQPFTGPVWNLLNQFASKPWIECFVTDTDSGPRLVYRFAPLRSYGSTAVAGFQVSPTVTTIAASDVESISISRTDNEIYTYYFTYPQYNLLDRVNFKGEGLDMGVNPFLDVGKISRYGFLPLECSTPLIPSLVPDPANVAATAKDDTVQLAGELNTWLMSAFSDNHMFYNGSITVKGGGGIQPGTYVAIEDLRRMFYVAGVSHSFSIAEGHVRTSLDVVRGHPMPEGGGGRRS